VRKLALLLRAVNVGGGKLLMADLKALLGELGYDAPQTLLASGNAVVETRRAADAVAEELEAALAARLGLKTSVFVRDHAGLAQAMAANPFAAFAEAHPSRMMVVFFAGDPPRDMAPLERLAVFGEQVAAGPGCLYITYPEGAGRSKLANARGEAARGTARNWNTVGKLAAMTAP
jgi:uncharacterized protein (DUF1697 family)